MKFVSFVRDGKASFGAVVDDQVVDLGARHPEFADLRAAIRAGQLDTLADEATAANGDFATSDIEFLPTIPNPEKVICIGVNYANRNEEYKDGSAAPKYPSVFMRTRESFVGHNQLILDPPESDQLDYEGEIVIVIGKEGRRVSQQDAHKHIAGLTIMNEGSLRDFLRHAKFNVTQGKNFDRSGALGPWIETDLSGIDLTDMTVTTHVNAELRQQDTTASMAFPFARIIEYISTFTELQPGDIIATGTPTGAGARFDPPRWLKPGDVVEVTVEGVGTLRNRVAHE